MAAPETDAAKPSLARLTATILLAVAWLAAAGVSAWTLLNDTPAWHDAAAGAFLLLAPVLWLLAVVVGLRRVDEVERSVVLGGLTRGLLFGCIWPGLMVGGSALSSLFLGAGQVNVGGMMQNAVTYAAIMPPLAFVMSEISMFAMLAVYGRKASE